MGRKAERRLGGGRRHAGGLGERDLAGPGDDRVTFLVEPPAPRTAGELQVLARRECGPAGSAVLGEALDHDRACRHVDPERERLGGEDDLEQPAANIPPPFRERPGPGRRGVRPRRAPGPRATRRSRAPAGRRRPRAPPCAHYLADGGALGGVGQADAIAHDLVHSIVAGRPAEDEHNGRQHLVPAELFDHLGAPRGRGRAARPPSPPCQCADRPPWRALRTAWSMRSPSPPACPLSCSRGHNTRLFVFPSVDREVVAQDNGTLPLHDDRRVPPHRAQPSAELVGVVDGGGEADEANLGRAEDENLLPDPAPVGVLNEVDLVEHHRVQALEEVRSGQQHVAQHFGGHHDDRGPWPQRRVSGKEADVFLPVGGDELPVLLVRERLERRRVERLAVGRQGPVDGIRRHQCLARPRGGGHQYRVP